MNSHSSDPVDTRDPISVCAAVIQLGRELYPREVERERIERLFDDVTGIFEGRLAYFQRMDAAYHNLEHTLQAVLCWSRILHGYQRHTTGPRISGDFFHLGLVAVLLHDIGYLKEEYDEHGTGAKFTLVHERRSCELAQIFLAQRGWANADICAVQHMISCTGQHAVIDAIPFRHPPEKILGQMLCTADYLGQMGDPNYPGKLPVLFQEFEESDTYRGVPMARRHFSSLEDLLARTPGFWYDEVLPKLEYDCGGLYKFLAVPYPHGDNPYLEAVHNNLDQVRGLLAAR